MRTQSFCRLLQFKMILPLLMVGTMLLALPQFAMAKANKKYASIVMDARTGVVLTQKNADKELHPASLTKMMTLYITFDALKAGRLSLNQKLRVSRHATNMEPSKLGLKTTERIRVKDAIYALVTKSANDVAVVLAENIAGSEKRFAQLMTKRAQDLGMSRTTFKNASGLHHKKQVSTARDMAKLSLALMRDHSEYYHVFQTQKFTYQGKSYGNHNKLLKSYHGMDGLKTGYVRAAGFNLAASAHRNGKRLIAVVFGGKSSKSRNLHMAQLLDRGFSLARKPQYASNRLKPQLKPQIRPGVALASASHDRIQTMSDLKPASGTQLNAMQVAAVKPAKKTTEEKAFEAFLLAELTEMARQKKAAKSWPKPTKRPDTRIQVAAAKSEGNWAAQIGASKSRKLTYTLFNGVKHKLPDSIYHSSEKKVVPLKTRNGVVYRARLAGLDKQTANRTCEILRNCLVVLSR